MKLGLLYDLGPLLLLLPPPVVKFFTLLNSEISFDICISIGNV